MFNKSHYLKSLYPKNGNQNSAPTGRIFMKFNIRIFLEYLSRKFKSHSNRTRIAGNLREEQSTFLIVYRSFLLGMRNVADKCCRENQNTHSMFSNFFEHLPVEIKWKNIVEMDILHTTICSMRIAC